MKLSVAEVARIAAEAALLTSPRLEISGVNLAGGSDYSEVLVTVRGCRSHPCQIAVGIFRDVPEAELRDQIEASLKKHLSDHPPS